MLPLSADLQAQLLGRSPHQLLSAADRAAFRGQRVLVTGGGGSIGSELCRVIAACAPAALTVIDQCEYALFQIEHEIRQQFPALAFEAVLGDVSRRRDIRAAVQGALPDVVYHAAACKHVPIAERSIVPATRTNVIGTVEAVRAAREAGARFVLISSDKAAEPRSVMGATKRLAELAALDAATAAFRPIVIRFGNILGSSGSLLEIMWRCVQSGRNIPVTDPDATRFFMTATEAVSLVLKADLLASEPNVFWLDMGAPQRIGTLAERFIAAAAAAGQRAVGIDVIGLRPGEKVHEELTTHGLDMRRTAHPRIFWARQAALSRLSIRRAVRAARAACAHGSAARSLSALTDAVADFIPSEAAMIAAGHTTLKRNETWAGHERSSAAAVGSLAVTW